MTTPQPPSDTPRTDHAEKLARESYEMSRECGDPPYPGNDLVRFAQGLEREVTALEEVAGWAQTVLTALNNGGSVLSGSKLHQKLREVMTAHRASRPQSPERSAYGLVDRITEYLQLGGLFNPELMNPEQVRILLMDCRDYLSTMQRTDQQ